MSDRDSFFAKIRDESDEIIRGTETDDEVFFLLMASIGRLADLFKVGELAAADIEKECIVIAAGAMSIAVPSDNPDFSDVPNASIVPHQDDSRRMFGGVNEPPSNYFFLYKHHSNGMGLRLRQWVNEKIPDAAYFKVCNADKTGFPLIGVFNKSNEIKGFVRSPSSDVAKLCEEGMRRNFLGTVPFVD